jgi:tungstate transport system substrate-binding protein
MSSVKALRLLASSLLTLALASPALAGEPFITIASTTSTENSGLFGHILPAFTRASGIQARVVAVGTGQAITLAQNGDADVLFVHHTPSEEKFVAEGFGVKRYDVMYNDFVLIGPASDPAQITGLEDATSALRKIARAKAPFASRGDDSGTHKKERGLWKEAGIDVEAISGDWYRETGSGMGATLNTASGMDAYVLSDRATWLKFGNKGRLKILAEGDPKLFNQYGIILVNPEKHSHVKVTEARAFIDWVLSEQGQTLIGEYTIEGQPAFFPNAQDR